MSKAKILDWRQLFTAPSSFSPRISDYELDWEIPESEWKRLNNDQVIIFSTRCARRVLPLVKALDRNFKKLVRDAIEFAENVAAARPPSKRKFQALFDRICSARWNSEITKATDAQFFALDAAYYAFETATASCADTYRYTFAKKAYTRSHDAAMAYFGVDALKFDRLAQIDFKRLCHYGRSLTNLETIDDIKAGPSFWKTRDKAPPNVADDLPHSELHDMPQNALLALASRRVAAVATFLPDAQRKKCQEILQALQIACANDLGDPLLDLSSVLCEIADELDRVLHFAGGNQIVLAHALYALGRAVRCAWAESVMETISHVRSAISFADFVERAITRGNLPELKADVVALVGYTNQFISGERFQMRYPIGQSNSGYRRGKYPQAIFAPYMEFDTSVKIRGDTIIEICPALTDEVLARLAENPRRLQEMSARQFEEVIARVFERYGFDVELTAPTRDGGRDVIAIAHQPARIKYLVECKRYSEKNTVGIAIVQRLHGVVRGDLGNKAILATTSSFTKPAIKYMQQPHVRYELEGRDFDGIQKWLVDLDRRRLLDAKLDKEYSLSPGGIIIPR